MDPETGFPNAIINADFLNGFRTAAADTAAVEVLARTEASVIGVLGGGHQAEFEIRALAEVRPLRLVKIWNRTRRGAERLRRSLSDLDLKITITSRLDAIVASDILVTASAAREPFVFAREVSPGTHISAMGADQSGKQELDVELVCGSRLFADQPAQAVVIGEFQHAMRLGRCAIEQITPLGAALLGLVPGRSNADEVTIFDSSGVALQDLMAAQAVLEAAREANLVQRVDF